MKKTLLLVLVTIVTAIYVHAQGTWKASGTEVSVAAGTEIALGISSLKCVHSDAAGVTGKSDTGAPSVTHNSITYANEAFIQGNTNGMYYAFLPSKSGILDISVKMGSGKATFVVELTDALWTSISASPGDLAALAKALGTANTITGDAGNFTLPSVYDTYNKKEGTWNGSAAIQSTGSNVWMVMSFPVSANKTYVVGCFGSKLMLRGVNLATTTRTGYLGTDRPEIISTDYFNLNGVNVGTQFRNLQNGVYIRKNTFSDGTVTAEKISRFDLR